MKISTIGTVIAERRLDVHPRGEVIVRIGKPRKFRGDENYYCPFDTRWPDRLRKSYCGGVDLYCSKLQLTWSGSAIWVFP